MAAATNRLKSNTTHSQNAAAKAKPKSRRTSTKSIARGSKAKKAAKAPQKIRADRPTGGKALITFERLMQAAGELLADVGFEKLTSNEICNRAGLTPPAFYHYFNDKYEVLAELAERLLKRQNDTFAVWLIESGADGEQIPSVDAFERLFQIITEYVAREPGGIWTIRALRALPNLNHVRLKWLRQYTNQLYQIARTLVPSPASELLWSRLRIMVEFSYVIDELVFEEDRIPRDVLIREAAHLIHGIVEDIVARELSGTNGRSGRGQSRENPKTAAKPSVKLGKSVRA
jgi:AcrR family transcriptional regulator